MEYTVQKLARLAGISARTLRFYDEIGLLRPRRTSSNGYRVYGETEVDALQQILFFRALGLELGTIAAVMQDASFNRLDALKSHLGVLEEKRAQLNLLIANVTKTIAKEEGSITMADKEKFEGLKRRQMDENEQQYGEEIRAKYGEDTVKASNEKYMKMSKAEYDAMQETAQAILDQLQAAVQSGAAPDSDTGKAIAALHRKWLGHTWPSYSQEAHLGLVQMYLDDARFTAYYDTQVPGCAQFLRDAVHAWVDRI